ncbi:hypothetical protein FS837_003927 [Tulasnella sp. UAMH 9824]|nr:hypothetical protein FS837_003927 [Tulasnella sp. UAMH 9824]
MSNPSNTKRMDGSSSSQPDHDLVFYTSLVFVLEPKGNASALSVDELKKAALALDPRATIKKDTRSKSCWLHASIKHVLEKFQKLAQKKASLGAFTIREVRPGSPEEDRIRGHITKWLASTARAPNDGSSTSQARTSRDPPTSIAVDRPRRRPPTHQSQQGITIHVHSRKWLIQDHSVSIPTYLDQSFPVIKPEVDEPRLPTQTDSSAQEDARPEGMDRRRSARRGATPPQSLPAPSHSLAPNKPPVPGTSRVARGKRAATSATFPDEDNAPVTVKFDGSIEYPNRVESALGRFVDKVAPHRLRWRSVSFNDVPPTLESYLAVARAFNGPAPALAFAKVTTIYGTTMPFVHSLRFFEGSAQALRQVTLTGVVPNISDVSIFANIESLRVI